MTSPLSQTTRLPVGPTDIDYTGSDIKSNSIMPPKSSLLLSPAPKEVEGTWPTAATKSASTFTWASGSSQCSTPREDRRQWEPRRPRSSIASPHRAHEALDPQPGPPRQLLRLSHRKPMRAGDLSSPGGSVERVCRELPARRRWMPATPKLALRSERRPARSGKRSTTKGAFFDKLRGHAWNSSKGLRKINRRSILTQPGRRRPASCQPPAHNGPCGIPPPAGTAVHPGLPVADGQKTTLRPTCPGTRRLDDGQGR